MSTEEQDWNYRGNYNGQPVDPWPQVNMAIGPLDNSMANANCSLSPSKFGPSTIDGQFGHLAIDTRAKDPICKVFYPRLLTCIYIGA